MNLMSEKPSYRQLERRAEEFVRIVKDLRNSLELQAMQIEKLNIALEVLLEKRKKDKYVLQEQVLSNLT